MQGTDRHKHLIKVDTESNFFQETEGCERINWRKKVCELHGTNFKRKSNAYTATCEYASTTKSNGKYQDLVLDYTNRYFSTHNIWRITSRQRWRSEFSIRLCGVGETQ